MTKLKTQHASSPQKVLIYCRVSDTKQKTQGHGLDSQEHRCRQFAASQGLIVEKVFPDDISGGGDFMNRPGMVSLINYIDANLHENYVVLFDDLKRFARDREFHFKLRKAFHVRNVTPKCLNFHFDDTPEGEFVEGDFDALLTQLQPTENLIGMATVMFKDIWEGLHKQSAARYCYLIIFICFIFLQKRSFYVSITPFPNFQVTIQRYN